MLAFVFGTERLYEMDATFDAAFSSGLSRASSSCAIMLAEMQQSAIPLETNVALNERDYGDLAGLDKDEARQQFRGEQVHLWRRSLR